MSAQKGTQEVVLEGRGNVMLRPADYVTTGGEGSIYRLKNTIVKIYTDTRKMRRDGMVEKLRLLASLTHPYIVAPKGIVTALSGEPLGFFMPFVSGEPFPRLFTNDFRHRSGFSDAHATSLAARMQETVSFAHGSGAVMVDANEMNWLASFATKNEPEPRVIDVDSWAIGRFKATVIMPSIRDMHARQFSALSDWFAWGIVSFELYTGIHPYKGTLAGFKLGEMERRMRENASVFSSGIRLNRAVRDFSCIPGPLLDWYIAEFQGGTRTIPPSPLARGIAAPPVLAVARVVTTTSGLLVYDKLFDEKGDEARAVFPCGIVLLASGRLVNLMNARVIGTVTSGACEVVRVSLGWLVGEYVAPRTGEHGALRLVYIRESNLEETEIQLPFLARGLVRADERLFAVTEQGLTEIDFKILGKPIVAAGRTWGAMPNATRWFQGVGVQDAFAATYLIIPFGGTSCAQVRARELDGLNPVAAYAGHRFVAVVAVDAKGDYHKLEFSFDSTYSAYSLWRGMTDSAELNAVMLPKGVGATIVRDGELTVFVPQNGTVNKLADKDVATDMRLAHWGDKVLYIRAGAVWAVRMQ